jgi:hypothetical protein
VHQSDELLTHRRHWLDARLSRRHLFRLSAGALTGALLGACRVEDDEWGSGTPTLVQESDRTRETDSASPEATRLATPEGLGGSPVADDSELGRFLALSRALTGFDDLDDDELAQVYMEHLGPEGDALDDLYAAAGIEGDSPSTTIEQMEDAGVFDDEALRTLADRITSMWYSGKYDVDGETVVATYITALAWPASGYRLTGPSTCSGAFGNWVEPPAA